MSFAFKLWPNCCLRIIRLILWATFVVAATNWSHARTEREEPEVLATRSPTAGQPEEVLLSETANKITNLWFTPEGPKKDVTVSVTYRYYIKSGAARPRELRFLQTSDSHGDGAIDHAWPIANSDQWIGVRSLKYGATDYRDETIMGRPHNLAIGRYEILVFSPEKLIRRTRLEAVAYAARFTYRPDSRDVRFWRNDGWWLLDPVSGQEQPEPGRPLETAPGNHGLTIPGTSARITFELPPFVSSSESIMEDRYSFDAATGSEEWQKAGVNNLKLRIQYGWHWHRAVRTREQLLKYYFDHPPADLPRTAQYIRVERIFPAQPEYGWAACKQLTYLSDMDGWPVEIALFMSAPFERWTDTIARFEATIQIVGESSSQ